MKDSEKTKEQSRLDDKESGGKLTPAGDLDKTIISIPVIEDFKKQLREMGMR